MKTWTGAVVAAAALAAAAGARAGDDPARAEAVRKLDTLRVSVDFQDATLPEAIDYLRDLTGFNIVLSPRAAEQDPDRRVRLRVRDLSVRTILKLVLRPRDLVLVWRDGAFLVASRGETGAAVVLKMYDIRTHLLRLQDFPGPVMELVTGIQNPLVGVHVNITPEPKDPVIPEEMLRDLIRANTGRASWDDLPEAKIEVANGVLVVTQTPAVHREIERLLAKLLQYR